MEYLGIVEKFQDTSENWRIRVNVGDNNTIFLKFRFDPTEEQVQIEAQKYIDNITPTIIVLDPYDGLTTEQRIAKKVTERLLAIGYSQEILAALLLNKITGRHPEEFDQMNEIRMQIIAQVYEEEGIPMPE